MRGSVALLLMMHAHLLAAALVVGASSLHTLRLSPRLATAWTRAPPPSCAAVADAEVIVSCSVCKAAYTVDTTKFGNGRKVHCSNCGHEWYQTADRLQSIPAGYELVQYPEEMKERLAAGKSAVPEARFRCFVGNLAFAASEDELRELFEPFGTVVSVTIMTDDEGTPRGFGFVNMESTVAGAKAVEQLNGVELLGRALSVSEGKQSQSRRGGGRGGGRGRGGRGRGGHGR